MTLKFKVLIFTHIFSSIVDSPDIFLGFKVVGLLVGQFYI